MKCRLCLSALGLLGIGPLCCADAPRGASAPLQLAAGAAASPTACVPDGDGYFRAHLRGAIDASIDWPNAGTRCQGEERPENQGVRLSFSREPASAPDLLFVFGISKVQQGRPAHGIGVNLTVIMQGTTRVFGTRSETRCTVDSLSQRPLQAGDLKTDQPANYRVEVHGFCTQPARAVRGDGAILMTSFDFAGVVKFSHAEQTT